jgi:hypothetical protein
VCDLSLVFHGAIVLIVSQLAGYAFFRALRAGEKASARAALWRMSHSACSAGAVFLIALAPVVPHLRLDSLPNAILVRSLVFSTYALCIGTVIAAASGQRGTRPGQSVASIAVYGLYVIGALGSTLGAIILLYGATRAYLN